jgi:hypothetical protein
MGPFVVRLRPPVARCYFRPIDCCLGAARGHADPARGASPGPRPGHVGSKVDVEPVHQTTKSSTTISTVFGHVRP